MCASGAKNLAGKRVAIIGGGYAGVGVAFHLRSSGCANITLYDMCNPGRGGASAVSAGIMHPINVKGKLVWAGKEGIEATEKIISYILNTMGADSIALNRADILCPIRQASRERHFRNAADLHPELVRIVADDRKQQDLDLKPLFVANLRQAVILDSPNYLMAFWNCMSKDSGFSLIREKIDSLDQMWSRFDHVVVAAGSDTPRLWPTALPISLIGGSNIIYDSKELNIPFDFSAIMDGKYIVHQKHNHEVICGATHTYDIHRARSQAGEQMEMRSLLKLKMQVEAILPELSRAIPARYTTGIRVSTIYEHFPGATKVRIPKVPLVVQHPTYDNVIAVTGLGSRGLLYHSLIGEYIARALSSNDFNVIPEELRFPQHNNRQRYTN